MQIKDPKFKIGDKVWGLDPEADYEVVEKKCDICKGKGEVKIMKKDFDCPQCYGDGSFEEEVYKQKIKSFTIKDIILNQQDYDEISVKNISNIIFSYKDKDYGYFEEKDVFKSKDEAETYSKLKKIVD